MKWSGAIWSRMTGVILFWMSLCVLPHAQAHAAVNPKTIVFQARTLTTATGTYHYRVFVPAHWNSRRKWPVILFLHGSDDRGTDNIAQTNNGIRLLIAQDSEHFPCIVVCPQCREDTYWPQPEMEDMALKVLDQSVREFHGDPRRVYLTGLSMGGYGTWSLAREYPERWAAVAPCCGGIVAPGAIRKELGLGAVAADPYFTTAKKIAHLPLWAFHGEADPMVPVSESRQMVAILMSMKSPVRYTEYPGVGHDCWDYAYRNPGLLPWLLSHKSASR